MTISVMNKTVGTLSQVLFDNMKITGLKRNHLLKTRDKKLVLFKVCLDKGTNSF